MGSAQYASLLSFLLAASTVLSFGVVLAFGLRHRLGNLRWAIALVFVLSMCAGALAARAGHAGPLHKPDVLDFLILLTSFTNFGPPLWMSWTARRTMGTLVYAFPRPGKRELVWSARAVMLMAALLVVPAGLLARWSGWSEAVYMSICAIMFGGIGGFIAKGLGRMEFREGGILGSCVLYPWAKLGKFEWMPGSPPTLRIQVRSFYLTSDIRIACPDDSEINGILVEHGLVRW